jgi:hypothetical protein
MEKKLTAMPTVAGILLLVSAGVKLLGAIGVLAAGLFVAVPSSFAGFPVGWLLVLVFVLLSIAAIAVVIAGGVSSLQRKRWGLALAGSIVAILPFSLLGIAATVLVALSRNEFEDA